MLNVYVPEYAFNDPQIKLPVMVWIYGGGFTRLELITFENICTN